MYCSLLLFNYYPFLQVSNVAMCSMWSVFCFLLLRVQCVIANLCSTLTFIFSLLFELTEIFAAAPASGDSDSRLPRHGVSRCVVQHHVLCFFVFLLLLRYVIQCRMTRILAYLAMACHGT
jgi:hypothetical protein